MNEKLECGPKASGIVERKKIRDYESVVSAALLRRAPSKMVSNFMRPCMHSDAFCWREASSGPTP